MKNVFKIGLLLYVLTFTKCQKGDFIQEKLLLSPQVVGELHNKVMTNFKENYVPKVGLSENKTLEDIISFNINFIDSEIFKIKKEKSNEKEINQLKTLFDTKKLIESSFYNNHSTNNDSVANWSKSNNRNAIEMVEYLFINNIICLSEKEILGQLLHFHKQNYELKISNSDLFEVIDSIRLKYYSGSYNVESIGSIFTASCLEISLSSNKWWQESLNNGLKKVNFEEKTQLAPWIIADFIGAFGAAFLNIIEQGYNDNSKPLDAEELMYAMLKSGVISSVAPWSRIAKLLKW